MAGKTPEDVAREMEAFDATELDDADLEDVVGGGNTNCGCGSTDNGNCGCPVATESPEIQP